MGISVKDLKREAPVNKGDVAGWIYYQINEKTVKKYPIYVERSVEEKTYADYLKEAGWGWIFY